LFVQGRDAEGRQGLHRVDVEAGTVTTITAREPANDIRRSLPASARDGGRLFFQWTSATSAAGGVAVRDLSSDLERRMTTQSVGSFALSPDSEWLAINEMKPDAGSDRRLTVIAASGGEPRALSPTVGQWTIRGPVAWSADGHFVFVVKMGDRDQELWQVPVDGSEPRDTGIRWSGTVLRLDAHPNGTRLALSTLGTSFKTWVLQNIPAQK
jgi:Tol biopolymer transport system component